MTSVETDSLPVMTLMRFINDGNRIPCTCSFVLMVKVFETECINKTGNFVPVKTITCEQETGWLFKEESPTIDVTTIEIPWTNNTTASILLPPRSNSKSKLPYPWIYAGVVVGVVLIPVMVIILILKCTSRIQDATTTVADIKQDLPKDLPDGVGNSDKNVTVAADISHDDVAQDTTSSSSGSSS